MEKEALHLDMFLLLYFSYFFRTIFNNQLTFEFIQDFEPREEKKPLTKYAFYIEIHRIIWFEQSQSSCI